MYIAQPWVVIYARTICTVKETGLINDIKVFSKAAGALPEIQSAKIVIALHNVRAIIYLCHKHFLVH